MKLLEEFGRNFVDIHDEDTTLQIYGFGADEPEGCFPLTGSDAMDDPNV